MPRYIKTYPLPAEYAQHQILEILLRGVQLDNSLNLADGRNSDGLISVDNDADRAGRAVLVISTDEEAMICYECEMLA